MSTLWWKLFHGTTGAKFPPALVHGSVPWETQAQLLQACEKLVGWRQSLAMLITSVSGAGTATSHPLCVTPGSWLQLGTSCHLLRSSPWSVLSQQWAHVQMAWTLPNTLANRACGVQSTQTGRCVLTKAQGKSGDWRRSCAVLPIWTGQWVHLLGWLS